MRASADFIKIIEMKSMDEIESAIDFYEFECEELEDTIQHYEDMLKYYQGSLQHKKLLIIALKEKLE